MNLYEITTGHWGESYERAYAWAYDEETARELFDLNPANVGRDVRDVRLLMTAASAPFCTRLNDYGWPK